MSARANQRIVAIGDIHGRWDLLTELVGAIDRQMLSLPTEPTRLVFLGDFIDRGASSDLVIAFLRDIDARYPATTILQGNHEATLLASARGDPHAQRLWIDHGGLATLASFGVEPRREDEDHFAFGSRIADGVGVDTLDWIEGLPRFLHLAPFFLCHAGIRPGRPLKLQREEDLLWVREPFLTDDRRHGAIVVHGHSISGEVEIRHNRLGLDTGAHKTGVLSAAILGRDENWIVAVKAEA